MNINQIKLPLYVKEPDSQPWSSHLATIDDAYLHWLGAIADGLLEAKIFDGNEQDVTDLVALDHDSETGITVRLQQEINRACGTFDHTMVVAKNYETKLLFVAYESQVSIVVNPELCLEQIQKLPEGTPADNVWEAL